MAYKSYFFRYLFFTEIKYIYFLLVVLCPLLTNAQLPVFGYERVSTEVERIEKGLSQNSIRTMLQDQYGFVWIGTWSGLNRYDGQKLTILTNDVDKPYNSITNPVINALAEDKNGNLWVGTESGLNKVELKTLNVTNFLSVKSRFQNLNDTILSLYYSENNTLWIGTQKGLLVLDLNDDSLNIIEIPLTPKNERFQVRSIKKQSKSALAIGTDHGFLLFNIQTFKFERIIDFPVLSSRLVLSILKINDSLWLIGTENGLNKLNLNTNKSEYIVSQNPKKKLKSNVITALLLDKDSVIWVATSGGGVMVLTGIFSGNYEFEPVTALPLHTDKLPGKISDEEYYYSLMQSKDGVIWLGSAWSGVFKLIQETNFFKKFQKTDLRNGISDNHIWAFYYDDNDLWIGTEKGLNIYNRKTHAFKIIDANGPAGKRLSSNQVRSIFKDSQGNFWIGTYKKGLNKYYPADGHIEILSAEKEGPLYVADNTTWKIVEDNRKNLWIATHNGLQKTSLLTGHTTVYRNIVGDSTSLSSNVVYNLYFDRTGSLWVATFDGLNLFLPEKNCFKVFKRNSSNPNSLNTNRIFSIYQDKDMNYWIGTIGGGLNRMDGVTGEVTCFTTNTGLPDNTIYAILDDEFGDIWMPTNYGISAFNIENRSFVNYTVNDGLTSNEFNFGAAMKDLDGNMYFGGMFGFNVLMPKEIHSGNLKPVVKVSEFRIDDEIKGYVLVSGDDILLNHSQKTIDIQLAMHDYINPFKSVYKYRIVNFDDQWRTLSPGYPFITFSKLPPGRYRLEVSAMNSSGIWTETPFQINIIVQDAWYNILIIRIIILFFVLLISYFFLQRRINRIRFKHKTERQLLELEKQTLRLQMNPHFIFNTLNSIQNFILKNDTFQSIGYLSKFSKLMRMMLNFSREQYISLHDEIALIESYLELERLRLEKSFSYLIRLEDNIEDEFIGIPPMIIQPFIENAIIHGLLPLQSRNGLLEIFFSVEEDFLLVKIKDNGVGRDLNKKSNPDHKPSGILITRKRLELINKTPEDQTSYNVIDLKDNFGTGAGTIVELKIKIEELEN